MKIFALLMVLMSGSAFAGTKLEIRLEGEYYVNNREIKINVVRLNQQLAAKGLDGLPETLVVGENPEAFWKLIMKRVRAANEALNREMHFNIYDDNYGEGYVYRLTLCYRGVITDVPKLLQAMNGNFLNPDQGILGIAAGSEKIVIDEAFASREGLRERFQEEYSTNLTNINKWLRYNPNSRKAIVMSDYGIQGDGTELELTEIPACR